MSKRMTMAEWRALARANLKSLPAADDWRGKSVAEMVRLEKARIESVRRAREKILSAQIEKAKRGEGPLTPEEIVQDVLDRASAEQHRRDPHNRGLYKDQHNKPAKRW